MVVATKRPVAGERERAKKQSESNSQLYHDANSKSQSPPPSSNSIGGRKAIDADPAQIANDFLTAHSVARLSCIRYWNGSWWLWSDGCYREMEEFELRALVVTHFKRGWAHVKREHVSNVVEHLRAALFLPSNIQPPVWISTENPPFEPHECFATATQIVHLPSLASNTSQFSVPASPAFFTLSAADFEVTNIAQIPHLWLAFLEQVWPGDQQSIDTLQEIFGYILTADTRQQKILSLIGPKRSGKGTIVRILRKLIGENNVAGPTLSSLSTQFGMSALIGKTLAVISDMRMSGRVDSEAIVERLLAISGEDKVSIDIKHRPAIHCQLPLKFLLLSNEIPRLSDATATIVSRFIMLRTTHSFYGREDTDLLDKLVGELPGIFAWAVEGSRRLRERGHFVQPASGQKLIDDMTNLASPVMAFVQERCALESNSSISKQGLYDEYNVWRNAHGIDHKLSQPVFGRNLLSAYTQISEVRPRTDAGSRERHYTGITLKDSCTESGSGF
jgi:putative DNA primase/helicase